MKLEGWMGVGRWMKEFEEAFNSCGRLVVGPWDAPVPGLPPDRPLLARHGTGLA